MVAKGKCAVIPGISTKFPYQLFSVKFEENMLVCEIIKVLLNRLCFVLLCTT